VARVLDEIDQLGGFQATASRLDAVLEQAEANPPGAAQLLGQIQLDVLPAPLSDDVRGLHSLIELRLAVRDHGKRRPDPARLAGLKHDLAQLRFAGVEPELAGQAQQDLAVQLFLAGYPAEARSLLPPRGPADHAAELLADLQALIVGKGDVVTAP